jgi:hypothetical protein
MTEKFSERSNPIEKMKPKKEKTAADQNNYQHLDAHIVFFDQNIQKDYTEPDTTYNFWIYIRYHLQLLDLYIQISIPHYAAALTARQAARQL